jgi:hypothetical protein
MVPTEPSSLEAQPLDAYNFVEIVGAGDAEHGGSGPHGWNMSFSLVEPGPRKGNLGRLGWPEPHGRDRGDPEGQARRQAG